MDQMEHNGPGFKYKIKVKKDAKETLYIKEWGDTELVIQTNDTYQKYRVTIEASNDEGPCEDKLSYFIGHSGMGGKSLIFCFMFLLD